MASSRWSGREMARSSLRSESCSEPFLQNSGKIEIGLETDADGPRDARGSQPACSRSRHQRGHANLARVPAPGAPRDAHGIEVGVVVDPVKARGDARDQRRVRRVGHRRQDADDTARVGPFGHQPLQVRRLDAELVSVEIVAGHQAVYGDHDDMALRGSGSPGERRQHQRGREDAHYAAEYKEIV